MIIYPFDGNHIRALSIKIEENLFNDENLINECQRIYQQYEEIASRRKFKQRVK